MLFVAVAAGCASSGGVSDPVASTTRPAGREPNELEEALRRFGVDVDAAPTDARQLGDARFCGAERDRIDDDYVGNAAGRRCFLEGNAAGRPVVFVLFQTSVEGDPIVTIYRSDAAATVEVFYDATRDTFGSGTWEHQRCTGVTTEFPDAVVPLPAHFFEATGCSEVGEAG
jgi:hypothetical protein